MTGGRSSQRKGRGGELEIVRILVAAGWSAIVKKIYDALDIEWEGDDCEVKRKATGMKRAYDAFDNGPQAVFFRADKQQWLVIHTLDGYARKHGPELKE